ncbi:MULTISPECIES: bacterioferritin [Methylocaldum]|jgi:bacterioferritin|uniref:bacterioferritin n=1 Tax=unclassified Methylocaldum TaxID=2622260 RepID=UPI00098B5F8B|nr:MULTISPECIES: bacterioferritin [unclassified Methylocaldum]MBP1152972.1 bacterioferritin [Methylocaldum sp. RMAD-M]MDV3242237.1 bacterioferritin [Methylocaldum sp.]MVF20493.1 bacterioferritin [Methylocaldum sp. BRCS4]
MKGNADVIARLNHLLIGELTSIDQYLIHSRMYKDWGFNRLYERIHHELQEEQSHADRLINRILFLEGVPDLSKRNALQIGQDVPGMLKNDLTLEYKVIDELKEAMAFCESVGDYVTRDILLTLLKDTEEDHAYWLEIQLGLIEKIGLQNYLQTQM